MGVVKNILGGMDESIPRSHLSVDSSLSLPVMSPRVIELCKDLFKKWSKLDDCRFLVETVAGGITNLLLKVTVKEESGEEVAVTVRLYGPNTDYVIDRERELLAIKHLSGAGFGAELLGIFENGMVQSFINARTLTPADMRMPKIAAEIARQLHKFHEVEIPGSREPQLWHDIFKFYENASNLQFDDAEKQKKYDSISFTEVRNEIREIQELTSLLNAPVVFSHNDLLSGNLMLNDVEEKLYFIDFEYGSYSYRGFDIGNHFNEYAGYDCDYNLYPSKDKQYHFFRHYLQPDQPDKVSNKDLEALYVETNTFMLASHLFWALWALIQAKMSLIDFDYLGYFFLRYNEYKRQKEKCCSLARSQLSDSQLDCNVALPSPAEGINAGNIRVLDKDLIAEKVQVRTEMQDADSCAAELPPPVRASIDLAASSSSDPQAVRDTSLFMESQALAVDPSRERVQVRTEMHDAGSCALLIPGQQSSQIKLVTAGSPAIDVMRLVAGHKWADLVAEAPPQDSPPVHYLHNTRLRAKKISFRVGR